MGRDVLSWREDISPSKGARHPAPEEPSREQRSSQSIVRSTQKKIIVRFFAHFQLCYVIFLTFSSSQNKS